MSSEDNKTITFDKPKKPHNKKSIGWIIGVVVLILISITFILPTTALAGNHEIIFGSIRGKDVSLTDQYFQTQASMASAQYGADANTLQGSYTIWNQAFLSTIANIGLSEMAKDAGIKTTDSYIDRAIVNSGFYSSDNGTFDPEIYENASSYDKNTFRAYIEDSVPASLVASDISRVHSSNAEMELVQEISAHGKAFDYVVLDSSLYPEEDVIAYATSNPDSFMQISFTSVTSATEDEASSLLASIANGETTIEEAAEASTSTTDGVRENVFYFTLEDELVNAEDASLVFATAEGETTEPLQILEGYTIYNISVASHMPTDPTEEEFDEARNYIAISDAEMMNAYLDERSAEFAARIDAGEDFFSVAEEMGIDVTTVSPTTANPSGYPLFSSFQMTDPAANLLNATYFNSDYLSQLYQSEEGTVLPAQTLSSGARLITRVGEESVDNASSSYISTMYTYLKPQMAMVDLQESIFRDPTFEDDFASVFFTQILGSSI